MYSPGWVDSRWGKFFPDNERETEVQQPRSSQPRSVRSVQHRFHRQPSCPSPPSVQVRESATINPVALRQSSEFGVVRFCPQENKNTRPQSATTSPKTPHIPAATAVCRSSLFPLAVGKTCISLPKVPPLETSHFPRKNSANA